MDSIYNSIIEALIFSSDEPISSSELIKAIKGIDGEDIQVSEEEIETCIENLNASYVEKGIAFQIVKIAGGFLFATKPEYAKYIGFLSSDCFSSAGNCN